MDAFEPAATVTIGAAPESASVAREPVLDDAKKCGPKTIPLYDCGGLAYVYCLKSAGHDGPHTP
ncbi:hypothetical protein [Streptomyces violaceus]|uniref:Uncharacterized protein n=1 Tax=Streptomyces violaceus TaxID=1936 RepID=A0ABZ1NKU1_STRVL